jgi:capsular exopolysaccharide synthesis family protein
MSRIQEILRKAEREGGVHRTRAVGADTPSAPHASAIAPAIPRSAPRPEPEAVPVAVDTRPWRAATPESVTTTRRATATLDPRLVAALAPQSIAAEQYRSLRTRLRQSENGRSLRSILITSPATGDGKSLTAANLALTMAQEFQQRVLLVDSDLRRPTVHRLFGLQQSPGLVDILMGGSTLEESLISIPEHHLTILPSGPVPTHPAELLGSSAMRRLLDTVRTQFDRVLLDMPPVAPLADVSIVASMIDGVLMIVRAGATTKPAIERALSGLDASKVLGIVLNEAGADGAGYAYEGYGYIGG